MLTSLRSLTLVIITSVACLAPAASAQTRSLSSYTVEDKKALVQGIAAIGALSFCDNNGLYASKVGPDAFPRMLAVLKSLPPHIAETGIAIFKDARGDGTVPMFTAGSNEMAPFTATDEASCRVIEDIVTKLLQPKGLFDVRPLNPDEKDA